MKCDEYNTKNNLKSGDDGFMEYPSSEVPMTWDEFLDMSYKQGLNIIVCHVNYQKRESASRDQRIVEEYCKQRNIPVYVRYANYLGKENFQSWARLLHAASSCSSICSATAHTVRRTISML